MTHSGVPALAALTVLRFSLHILSGMDLLEPSLASYWLGTHHTRLLLAAGILQYLGCWQFVAVIVTHTGLTQSHS